MPSSSPPPITFDRGTLFSFLARPARRKLGRDSSSDLGQLVRFLELGFSLLVDASLFALDEARDLCSNASRPWIIFPEYRPVVYRFKQICLSIQGKRRIFFFFLILRGLQSFPRLIKPISSPFFFSLVEKYRSNRDCVGQSSSKCRGTKLANSDPSIDRSRRIRETGFD